MLNRTGYYFIIHPISKYPLFLEEYKDCLTDEVLDSAVIIYVNNGIVVFIKIIINVYNIPEGVFLSADFLQPYEHRKMLSIFPKKIKNNDLYKKSSTE